MTIVDIHKDKQAADLARRATEHFRDNPQSYTFADGDPKAGELMVIRWNPFTVLVLRIQEDEAIRLYSVHQFIPTDLPKLKPNW